MKRIQTIMMLSLLAFCIMGCKSDITETQIITVETSDDQSIETDSSIESTLEIDSYSEEVYDEETDTDFVKNQLLVTVIIGTDYKTVEAMADDLGADILDHLELGGVYQIEFRENQTTASLYEMKRIIETYTFVQYVSPNYTFEMGPY